MPSTGALPLIPSPEGQPTACSRRGDSPPPRPPPLPPPPMPPTGATGGVRAGVTSAFMDGAIPTKQTTTAASTGAAAARTAPRGRRRRIRCKETSPSSKPPIPVPPRPFAAVAGRRCRMLTRPSTGTPLVAPDVLIALESSLQSGGMRAKSQSVPRPSPLTTPPVVLEEGKSPGLTSTSESPPSQPSRSASPTPVERKKPRDGGGGAEDCCMC